MNRLLFPYMTPLLTLVFTIFSSHCRSQDQGFIDSLINIIETRQQLDKQVDALNELAWVLRTSNQDQALKYALDANQKAIALGNNKKLATSLNRIGEIERLKGNFRKSISYFERALKIEYEIEHLFGIGRAKFQLATLYRNLGEHNKSLEYAKNCVQVFHELNDKTMVARSYQRIALAYQDLGYLDSALHALTTKIEIEQKLNNPKLEAGTNAAIGKVYYQQNSFFLAKKAYSRAIRLIKGLKNPLQLASLYTDLGNVYLKNENFRKADSLYKESIKITDSLGFKQRSAFNIINLGIIAKKQGDLPKAKNLYISSIELLSKGDYTENLANSYFNLGNIYKILSNNDSAKFCYQKAIATNPNSLALRMESSWNLIDLFYQEKRLDSARFYQKEYGKARDSTDQLLKEAIIAKDNFERLRKEKALLQKDNLIASISLEKRNQLIIGLTFIILLLFLALLFFFRNNRLKQRYLLKQQRIDKLLKDHELKEMGAMIEGQEKERKRIAQDLHDRLGSMLSMVKIHFKSVEDSIQALQSQNLQQYEKANSLLDEACDEVRKIAHDMESGVLSKFGLIAALQSLKKSVNSTNQLALEILDFGFKNERLDSEVEINLYRIIQELLSNVLKHADANEMTIQLFKKEENLNLLVEDNGIGFDPNNQSGMGLKNVLSRVEKLNGDLIFDTGKGSGTTITIDIPINKYDKSIIS